MLLFMGHKQRTLSMILTNGTTTTHRLTEVDWLKSDAIVQLFHVDLSLLLLTMMS